MTHQCPYCKKIYKQEQTLIVHVCEQKRRAFAKNDKHVIVGFTAFNRFYTLLHKCTKLKTYEEFCASPFYNAFVKFGSFVNNVDPLYPDKFIDYVVCSGVKIDDWCKDGLYDKYVVALLKSENVETALTRSITYMDKWATENHVSWNQYFNLVKSTRFTFDVKDGKISPWLILNAPSAREVLNKISDEQLDMIQFAIDPIYWIENFKKKDKDLQFVKHLIQESNL